MSSMIFISSDTAFNLFGLRDVDTGEYVNTATVVGYLKDMEGNVLTTFNYTYVDDSDGDYQGTLTAADSEEFCEPCRNYIVDIVATAAGNVRTFSGTHVADIGGYS